MHILILCYKVLTHDSVRRTWALYARAVRQSATRTRRRGLPTAERARRNRRRRARRARRAGAGLPGTL